MGKWVFEFVNCVGILYLTEYVWLLNYVFVFVFMWQGRWFQLQRSLVCDGASLSLFLT